MIKAVEDNTSQKLSAREQNNSYNPTVSTHSWYNENLFPEVTEKSDLNCNSRDFPDGLVAKSLYSQCRGPRLDPWSGNYIPHAATKMAAAK